MLQYNKLYYVATTYTIKLFTIENGYGYLQYSKNDQDGTERTGWNRMTMLVPNVHDGTE